MKNSPVTQFTGLHYAHWPFKCSKESPYLLKQWAEKQVVHESQTSCFGSIALKDQLPLTKTCPATD